MSWSAVPNAEVYKVYRVSYGTTELVATVPQNYLYDTSAFGPADFTYYVVASAASYSDSLHSQEVSVFVN